MPETSFNLYRETLDRLGWIRSLGREIRATSRRQHFITVLTLMAGQVALVLSMFLPLKAILLMATDGVPWYLSAIVSPDTKDAFIIGLALGALAFYGLHLLCQGLISAQVRAGAALVLARSRKLALFKDDSALVQTHYLQYCRMTASALLAGFAGVIGLIIFPSVFVFFAALFLTQWGIAHYSLRRDSWLGHAIQDFFRHKRGQFFTTITSIDFLLGFALLFAQFLATEERNAITAILTILLLRQVTMRTGVAIQDFIALTGNQHRINPLFYTNIRYAPPPDASKNTFVREMTLPRRDEWLTEVLQAVTDTPGLRVLESIWNDTGTSGIAALDVNAVRGETTEPLTQDTSTQPADRSRHDYFIRCFAENRLSLGEHEAALFTSGSAPDFAPRYLAHLHINGFLVLVFEGLPQKIPERRVFARATAQLQAELQRTPINRKLLDSCLRTHTPLPGRITPDLIDRMLPAARSEADRAALQALRALRPQIQAELANLPIVLHNKDLTHRFSRVCPDRGITVWAWHRWEADTMLTRPTKGHPPQNENESRAKGDDSNQDDPKLAILLHQLEQALQREQPSVALSHARNAADHFSTPLSRHD